jgi:hypothetical protein
VEAPAAAPLARAGRLYDEVIRPPGQAQRRTA